MESPLGFPYRILTSFIWEDNINLIKLNIDLIDKYVHNLQSRYGNSRLASADQADGRATDRGRTRETRGERGRDRRALRVAAARAARGRRPNLCRRLRPLPRIDQADGEILRRQLSHDQEPSESHRRSSPVRGSGAAIGNRAAVHKPANEHRGEKDVKIRVPMAIMRGGMRLGAIIPGFGGERMQARLREQGIDLDLSKLDPAAIETMLKDLGEMNIDIDSGNAQVRITCE